MRELTFMEEVKGIMRMFKDTVEIFSGSDKKPTKPVVVEPLAKD